MVRTSALTWGLVLTMGIAQSGAESSTHRDTHRDAVAIKRVLAKVARAANDPARLQRCYAKVGKNNAGFSFLPNPNVRPECPHKTVHQNPSYCRRGADGVLYLPGDATALCSTLAYFMANGRLPATPAEIKRRGLWMVDAGAAFGGETMVGHSLGFRVLAFEGRPDEAARIVKGCGSLPGVTVLNALLTNGTHGHATLYNAGASASIDKSAVSGEGIEKTILADAVKDGKRETIEVEAMSLAYAAARHNVSRVAVLKADVQGHEFEVLLGALPILVADKPILYFEYVPRLRGEVAPLVLCAADYLGYSCNWQVDMVICVHPAGRHY